MKNHRKWAAGAFLLACFALLFFFLSDQGRGDSASMEQLGIIAFDEKIRAPDFTLQDLDGTAVSLRDFRGKLVLLNFWASWCPPCRAEIPSMKKLQDRLKEEDFVLLAVDLRESSERVRSFRDKEGLNFLVLLDTDGAVGIAYAVRSIPTTYLIDSKGYIIGAALGPRDWGGTEVLGLINGLLKSPS
ncbi:MAG: TlpA family protein disulfide reductase [Deltaproteobacteria bacterium]|nr:TlpA family protein disulfide reductase [Deltaproteobacteria bacterium]MBW2120458.1 TlpA family protein disulfide reductase [Deltaproteobacteria bacterium]